MKKKLLTGLLLLSATAMLGACGTRTSSQTSNEGTITSTETGLDAQVSESQFTEADTSEVSVSEGDPTITLNGSTGTISDTTRGSSGATVQITSKGTYWVTGSSQDVTIEVYDTTESGTVYLVLDNVSMTHSSSACILVRKADKVIIQTIGASTLTSTMSAEAKDADGNSINATIMARDDLTMSGSGTLNVNSSKYKGISCKDDLKITDGTLIVVSEKAALDANDSIRIGGGKINATSNSKDAVHVENDDSTAYYYQDAGEVTLAANKSDGIKSNLGDNAKVSYDGGITISGATVNITAGGGSSKSKNSSESQKGVKTEGLLKISDGTLSVSAADDALHSDDDILISGGTVNVSSSDDGVHAEDTLTIEGGTVNVTKSYEGLEAYVVNIAGGNINIAASDDGINAAGGSDSSSGESPWSYGGASSSTGTLNISGGDIYVSCSGDGLDSNGSLYISGGNIIVEQSGNGNGPLDYGDGSSCVCQISGGTVLAIGSASMAVNFNSGSQCSALIGCSGSAGTLISQEDSGFSYTAKKSFSSAVFSSPKMSKGNTYTFKIGDTAYTLDFSQSLYYSSIQGGNTGGGPGNQGGGRGNPW